MTMEQKADPFDLAYSMFKERDGEIRELQSQLAAQVTANERLSTKVAELEGFRDLDKKLIDGMDQDYAAKVSENETLHARVAELEEREGAYAIEQDEDYEEDSHA